MRPALRPRAAIATLLVLAAGCTQEPERDLRDVTIGSATGSPATSPSPVGRADVPSDVGRLIVLDELGNLVTTAPNGSDAVVLVEAVQGETFAQQPTWSPDGSRIAWVHVDVGASGTSAALVTTTADGQRPTETPTAVVPFYLSWDPTASRIAYLGSSTTSDIQLGIVELADPGTQPVPLDGGSPFYLSWDPSGEQLLVHVGTDRLERLELDGTLTTVAPRPGVFDAPVWTSDGRSLVYASAEEDGQRLVAHDLEDERGEELVRFEGAITFVVSPNGRRVAYQVFDDQGGVGPLSVLDRRTGSIEPVASGATLAYFWSPAGDRLLYLLPEPEAEQTWFRWGLWDGDETFTTTRFIPTVEFGRDYLQFFEQYAQSSTLWAPDGRAFVYAGSNEAGQAGIWIQPARSGTEAILVADGVFAAWSPS